MKIQSIHIYGFGQFENKVIQFHPSQSLAVLYGQNEAGKSTIMAFIHAIFFGFPSRNQNENRYEPKTGEKYGGKVTIETSANEKITIERVAGRSTGEVTIYNREGKISGEDELQSIFKGLDRALYQSIFSFGFKGLQAVENVTSAELSHYLFTAGTTGGQALFDLEKKITKKLDELYKPSGRKPFLNEKLNELENLRNELKKWEGKIEGYNKLVEEQEHLAIKLQELESQITHHQLLIKAYEKKQMLQPHIEERKKWQIQLSQIKDFEPFPVNGLERLQQLQHEIRPLKGQESSITNKISELHKELSSIDYQDDFIAQEAKVRSLKEKQKVIEMQELEKEKIHLSLTYEQSEISMLIEKLGISYSEEMIKDIDTSLAVKEQLKDLTTKQGRLSEQQKFLDEQFNKAKADLEVSEVNFQKLMQENEKKNSSFLFVFLYIAVIAIGIILWVISDSVYPLIISIVLLFGIFLNKFTYKNGKGEQLEKERVILKQKESLFEDILKQYESWEQAFRKVNDELTLFCSRHKLPKGLPTSFLMSAFEWIEELKRRIRTKNHLLSEVGRLEKALSSFRAEVNEMIQFFNCNVEPSFLALNQMITIIEREKEKKYRAQQLKEKLKEYNDEKIMVEQQVRYLESEISKLFADAYAEDEGAFIHKGRAYEEYTAVKAKLQAIESYLYSVIKAGEERYLDEVENENIQYDQEIEKITEELTRYHDEMKQIQVRMADITVEMKNLEEGIAYSELVHRFEALKAEFQEAASQWVVYKVAKDLIDRTKAYYREVRLPHVIQTAQVYFSFLTFEKYPHIFAPTEESGFIVERHDGFLFAPNELSQATTEQLYLSLRLALANSFHSLTPLPILIDDSFVNFDIDRTKRALQLIREISNVHQVLFFTCHKHIAELFDEDEVINL